MVTIVFLIAAGAVTLWLTVQHVPAWYRPAKLAAQDVPAVRGRVTEVADYVSDQMVKRRQFDITLTDTEVNEWLAAGPDIWPDWDAYWPQGVIDPAVRFDDGEVALGARINRGPWEGILSLRFHVTAAADGRRLAVRLAGLYGGSLPVPQTLLQDFLQPLLDSYAREMDRTDMQTLRGTQVRTVQDLFDGVTVSNRFVWPNGQRDFRIVNIACGAGRLILTCEPM